MRVTAGVWAIVPIRVLLCLSVCLAGAANAQGQRFALLVGVSDYQYSDGVKLKDLPGVANDIVELEKVVLEQWQVPKDNLLKLVDADASRENVLDALDELDERSRKGDWVFIYFSGHGTSSHALIEADTRIDNLPDSTGAFLPADFNMTSVGNQPLGGTDLLKQMLVGRWDLKPRLIKLDKKGVESFVVIDACFSADAFRSMWQGSKKSPKGLGRFVPITASKVDSGSCDHCVDNEAVQGYNYRNTVVFYASANDQAAEEITLLQLRESHRKTLSNKRHGLYTDGLLRALHQVDESKTSYEDLFQLSKDLMHKNCSGKCTQDPGFVPVPTPRTIKFLNKNVIASITAESEIQGCQVTKKSLAIGAGFQRLREQVAKHHDFELGGANADFHLVEHNSEWGFYTQGGAKVVALNAVETHFSQWLSSRAWLDFLDCEIHARGNDFGLTLRNGDGLHGDIALPETKLYFSVNATESARLLLLDINAEGDVYVLYPFAERELARIPASRSSFIPGKEPHELIRVQAPFGKDAVWLVAFSDDADLPLLQAFAAASDSVVNPRGNLMQMLRARLEQPGGIAQRRLNLFTLKD